MPYILKHCDITQLVVPLAYLMYENRKDVCKVGLEHIATFVLLKLSGERNFGVALNKVGKAESGELLVMLLAHNGCQFVIMFYSAVYHSVANRLTTFFREPC